MELYLLRHADAGDPMAWEGPDEIRPLSDKGERQADRLGRFLAGSGFKPDAILTSPKVRAIETARIVGEHLNVRALEDTRLAGGLSADVVEAILGDAGDADCVVLVGHDPDFSDLVAELCGASQIPMKKGALARIDCARPLMPGAGTLRWLVPPDLLKSHRADA